MRDYELMVIVNASLNDEAAAQTVGRYTEFVQSRGGEVHKVDHWGRREFAYEIDHMREGYYAVVEMNADPDTVAELERQLRLSGEIVRHKLIRPSTRVKRVG